MECNSDRTDNVNLKKLQQVNLEMIKLFLEICEKYQLTYFALGGTLLGAVRHQGFIPWDDDVDMGMPRPDYERFLTIAKKELTGRYRLRTIETNDEYRTYFCKIEDTEVKLVREFFAKDALVEKQVYAWIDIMPIDGVPEQEAAFEKHHEKMLKARKWIAFSLMDKCLGTSKKRSKKQMLIIRTGLKTGVFRIVKPEKAFAKFDALCQKYPYETAKRVGNTYGIYKQREFVDKKIFGAGAMLPFEDIKICCPEDYDAYLTSVYGDYMRLPDEADRQGHEVQFG